MLVAQTELPAKGHTPVTDEAVAPTCTETGLTEGSHCSVCNEVLVAQTELPAKGHTPVTDEAVAPTCTEQGYTIYTCSICGYRYTDDYIDALKHNIVQHAAKTATCTEKGWNAYETCSRCDYSTYSEIVALGHEYVRGICQRVGCGKINRITGITIQTSHVQNLYDDFDFRNLITFEPEDAYADEVDYSFTTSDKRIISLNNGIGTGLKEGSAYITIKASDLVTGINTQRKVLVTVKDFYKPTAVKLDKTGTVNLNLGETLTLTPRLAPETAQATYSWKTSSTKIAKVEGGVVTPVGEGTATITVTAKRGSVSKSATVKIKVVDPYKPTSVKLDKTGTVNLNLGATLTLTPSLSPETAQATYTWKTSSTKIAKVEGGVVTPVGEGTVTITVTAKRGSVSKTATVKVKVVDPYKPTSVKLDKTGTVNLNLGETLTLTPSLSPETAQATYTWKTSSTKIAKVEGCVVTPVAEGTATITVTATRGKIKKTATVKVKVVDPYKPTAVKLDKTGTVNLNLGETLTLTPSLAPETAQATYSWKTSSTKIAKVADGVVTPVAEGTATITVTAKRGSVSKTATVKVKVVDLYKPTSVKLDKTGTVNLNLGETLTLTPSLAPETAQATYSWKTSSTKIATVEGGVVTPVGEGTATITVTAKRGSVSKTATVKIKVVDPYKPTAVKLDKTGTVGLNLGETLTLTPSLSPETAQATYTWKTSSTKIAKVEGGVVTTVAEGTATITVTAKRGSVSKSATVKVKVVDPYKPTAVKLDKTGTVNLNLGETLTLTPSLSPGTAQATYIWKTSSTKIAKVESGVVTPVAEGTATITVTAKRGSVTKTATVKVKVIKPNTTPTPMPMSTPTVVTENSINPIL